MTPAAGQPKLGLIAGGGDLPAGIARRCRADGRDLYVLRLRGFADPALAEFPGEDVGLAELGRALAALKRERCVCVCLAGRVARPNFSELRPDLRGLRALPGAAAAAARGDDALLRFLMEEFEAEGFQIEGAERAGAETLGEGPLGRIAPGPADAEDLRLALRAAQTLGSLDAGQAAAVSDGVILALEAQEGTDALLRRCAALPEALRGRPGAPRGVLVKWPKPGQDRRADLPVVGETTVRLAAEAGLRGIAGEAGATLVIDPDGVRRAADALGVFVVGLPPDRP